jgi:hypothetical protein
MINHPADDRRLVRATIAPVIAITIKTMSHAIRAFPPPALLVEVSQPTLHRSSPVPLAAESSFPAHWLSRLSGNATGTVMGDRVN